MCVVIPHEGQYGGELLHAKYCEKKYKKFSFSGGDENEF